jgi:hypothetical protein
MSFLPAARAGALWLVAVVALCAPEPLYAEFPQPAAIAASDTATAAQMSPVGVRRAVVVM